MYSSPLSFLLLLGAAQIVSAHMSPYMKSMFGMYTDVQPFTPIGPDWTYDDWWFRGAPTRNAPPPAGEVSLLPAGGTLMLEIACNLAFTSLGWSPTNNVACPGNNGAYHAGDPAGAIDPTLIAGCALAIADVVDIEDVTIDNLAVFSVQKNCVFNKDTSFSIPAKMPSCTGASCMCAWMWEPQNGTGNYYQTPFRCKVTGSPAGATPINMPLVDPVYCPTGKGCTVGAKRPIYFYNSDYWNVNWVDNYHRPGYHASWSFNDGAQNDIFMTAAQAAKYVKPTIPPKNVTSTYVYPLNTDLALSAVATASSFSEGSPPSAANDGVINGYFSLNGVDTGNDTAEWSSNGEQQGAWLLLTWQTAVTISSVVMYDRPNWNDNCKAGKLTFSDGYVVIFGTLDNGGAATPVSVTPRTTTTLLWTCTQVSAWTSNVGLAEIEVYGPSGNVTASSSSSASSTTVRTGALSSTAKTTMVTTLKASSFAIPKTTSLSTTPQKSTTTPLQTTTLKTTSSSTTVKTSAPSTTTKPIASTNPPTTTVEISSSTATTVKTSSSTRSVIVLSSSSVLVSSSSVAASLSSTTLSTTTLSTVAVSTPTESSVASSSSTLATTSSVVVSTVATSSAVPATLSTTGSASSASSIEILSSTSASPSVLTSATTSSSVISSSTPDSPIVSSSATAVSSISSSTTSANLPSVSSSTADSSLLYSSTIAGSTSSAIVSTTSTSSFVPESSSTSVPAASSTDSPVTSNIPAVVSSSNGSTSPSSYSSPPSSSSSSTSSSAASQSSPPSLPPSSAGNQGDQGHPRDWSGGRNGNNNGNNNNSNSKKNRNNRERAEISARQAEDRRRDLHQRPADF